LKKLEEEGKRLLDRTVDEITRPSEGQQGQQTAPAPQPPSESKPSYPRAQPPSSASQGANPPQGSRNVGGKETVEVAMPQGFKAIRLVGMKGLPVAGYPVTEQSGDLNPRNWKLPAADLAAIDVDFARLLEALRLGREPRLLQGMTYTESFASRHLDEQGLKRFFPSGRRSPLIAGQFGSNEFERKQLFAEFLKSYEEPLRQSLPKTPFEFIYVEQMLVGIYDDASRAFPLSNRQGQSGTLTLHGLQKVGNNLINPIVIKVPNSLPMEPQSAQTLLNRLPNQRSGASSSALPPIRHAYYGVRLAITGFSTGSNRQLEIQVEPRAIGLYEDPLLARSIYEYSVRAETSSQEAVVVAAPLLPHLANLYAMRDADGFMSDDAVRVSAQHLIKEEQFRRQRIASSGAPGRCRDKRTEFEWTAARAELANGPLLDVLMDPGADWSFLNKETRFGMVADHCVELFVFPRQKIEGRQPDFAARELAPTYRKTLEAAIARLPKTVFINRRLTAPRYDHQRKVLVFEKQSPAAYQPKDKPVHMLPWTYGTVEYLAAGEVSKFRSTSGIRAPKSAEGLAIYDLVIHDNKPLTTPPHPPSLSGSAHGEAWRMSVQFRGDRKDQPRALALDRHLQFPEINLDPATAEQLINEYARPGDQTMRAIIVLEVDKAQSMGSDSAAILFARLKHVVITTHQGRQVAVLNAASFPDAVASYGRSNAAEQNNREASAKVAAEKKAAEESRAATLREGLRNTDIIGIRLGMTVPEAEKIVRKHMDVGWVARLSDNPSKALQASRPYGQFKTFIRSDGGEQITLFWHPDISDRIVAATRSLRLPEGTSQAAVLAQLLDKYGDKPAKKDDASVVWTFDFGNQKTKNVAGMDTANRLRNGTCHSQLGRLTIRDLQVTEGQPFDKLAGSMINKMTDMVDIRVWGGRLPEKRGGFSENWDPSQWRACGPMVLANIDTNRGTSLWVGIHDLAAYAPHYTKTAKEPTKSAAPKINL
jgi:hypothetical protein